MIALGRILFVVHLIFLLLAAILIGGSIGGFLGSGYMIVAAALVIIAWGMFAVVTFDAIRHATRLARESANLDLDRALYRAWLVFLIGAILSVVTGLGLGFLAFIGCGPLWLASLYHWGGMIGAVLGFAMFFLLPWIVRMTAGEGNDYATRRPLWKIIVTVASIAVLWGLAWLIPYLLLKGDINESEYKAADHLYLLPFPSGESTWVIQGNNSSLNHNNDHNGQKFSWDFRRRCGTPVLAARDGTIQKVTDTNDGMGGNNNEIQINQGADGTVAFYLHIQQGSVPARFRTAGTTVKAGDEIAKVGSVGNSMTGHIHFMVKRGGTTIGASFTDVKDDKGIPRTFHSYTSGNRKVP
jgi:hypothetical protein